jgi:Ca2+-binding EF-hand superfamily protein
MSFDADGDGRVTRAELPQQLRQRFDRMDENSDGAIDAEEARAMARRGRPRRGD